MMRVRIHGKCERCSRTVGVGRLAAAGSLGHYMVCSSVQHSVTVCFGVTAQLYLFCRIGLHSQSSGIHGVGVNVALR
jgi:hypothetical protein